MINMIIQPMLSIKLTVNIHHGLAFFLFCPIFAAIRLTQRKAHDTVLKYSSLNHNLLVVPISRNIKNEHCSIYDCSLLFSIILFLVFSIHTNSYRSVVEQFYLHVCPEFSCSYGLA